MSLSFIVPQWPAPANIIALTTTRQGGVSEGVYKSLNLGAHVLDQEAHVQKNRELLNHALNLSKAPYWLEQVHGIQALQLPNSGSNVADASYTRQQLEVCAVLSADCLPVLVCNYQGDEVAAIHAGWKGLAGGVIESCVQQLKSSPRDLMAWLGPAISQPNFAVGEEVLDAFIKANKAHEAAFIKTGKGQYQADLYLIARQKLEALGVKAVYGGDHCVYEDQELFYSFRRDHGVTGRMASLIYFK